MGVGMESADVLISVVVSAVLLVAVILIALLKKVYNLALVG